MKIDKIIFSSSELFSPWWNIQAPIWRSMGIEPVCILWGKVENTDMNPELGEIIEKEFNPDLFESFQITWSKFYHTSTEPETTWIIGDMDLVPLQSKYFTDGISILPDDCYTHLAFGEIGRHSPNVLRAIARQANDRELTYLNMFDRRGGFYDGGMDIPAYYHVAKGKTFSIALGLKDKSFDEQVKWVTESKKFGLGPLHDNCFHHPPWDTAKHLYQAKGPSAIPIPEEELYIWVADEGYSSHRIFSAHKEGKITFISHRNPIMTCLEDVWPTPNRLDRGRIYHDINGDLCYINDLSVLNDLGDEGFNRLQTPSTYNNYLDVHCFRPFKDQEKGLHLLLSEFWPNVHV